MTTRTTPKTFTLSYVKTIGIVNNQPLGRGFQNPYDLAISRDGRIFVLNRADKARFRSIRVGICNMDEEYLGEFGRGFGSDDDQFGLPVAMAFDSEERLYVTDEYYHNIKVFDTSGELLNKWGVFGSRDGQINGPSGIGIDAEDNIYIVDQHNNRIQKFTSDGHYLLKWGEQGSGDGQFNLPWGLSLDSEGTVYVADWRNDRIQTFSPEGKLLAKFGGSGDRDGQFVRPSGVAVDADGYIYVADWGNERVQVLRPDGRFQLMLRGQATLSKWAEEWFEANPDEKEQRDKSNLTPPLQMPPHLDSPYHISSQIEPYFWGPVSVKLDKERRLYVTEHSRHRIQVYQKG